VEERSVFSKACLYKSGLMSAKGGLMMGTKNVGALSSPQKRTVPFISGRFKIVKSIN
jgi:hypothetical protein